MSKVKEKLVSVQETEILNEKQLEALRLHNRILTSGQIAAEALVELAECLKEMRDSKLYIELGYENFNDYCEQKAGIKQRQAYNFISSLENLGKDYLQSNAKLGITKLAALASLSDSNREELENTVDVENVSTRELQEEIDRLMKKCEQLSLECEEYSEVDEELAELKEKKEALEKELKELREKPVEVAVAEPDEKTLEKIRKEAEAKHKAELESQKKLLKEAQARADELKKKAAAENEENKKAIEELKTQNLTLQANANKKPTPPSGNKELLKYHFEEITRAFNSAVEIIGKLETEEKEKYAVGFLKVLEQMRGQFDNI